MYRPAKRTWLMLNGLQWLLTCMPGIWLSSVFAASIRGWALIGYLPKRAVATPEADLTQLGQDQLFQFLFQFQDILLVLTGLLFFLWIPFTLGVSLLIFLRYSHYRWLRAGLHIVGHVGLYALFVMIYATEPTHRADWLFD